MTKLFYQYNRSLLALLLPAALFTTSCKRLVEISANPPSAIAQGPQFADSSITMTAIAGIYSYPSNGLQGFTFNDGLLAVATGLTSDELGTSNTSQTSTDFFSNRLTPLNYTVGNLWGDPYVGMYPVNAALEGIAASPGLSASLKKQLIAELKVVRALYYFALVNIFGDVPLVTSSDYTKGANIPRSPVDSVYAQMIRDLTEARQDLPVSYPSAGKARPNQYTAAALLAKVYLYHRQWQDAYEAANAVIGSGLYSLEADLNNVFLDGSKEALWQLPVQNGVNMTEEAVNFIPYSSGTVPQYFLTQHLLDSFETGDQRLQKWMAPAVVNNNGVNETFYYPFKYKQVRPASPIEDFMILRLGDTYLIRAEASAHLGNTADALQDIDLVRARAGLLPSTAVSPEEVLSAIQHERLTELFSEWGNRWFDLKRTGTIDAVLGLLKPGWQSTDALYPIPVGQLNLDGMLKQNPGYN